MMNFHDELKRMAACSDGAAWARDYPTAQAAWEACERVDWMLWLLRRTERADDPRFRAFALECARAVEHLGSPVCRETLDVVERYICGEASGAELVASSAWAAAADAAAAAAAADAWAAAARDAARAAAAAAADADAAAASAWAVAAVWAADAWAAAARDAARAAADAAAWYAARDAARAAAWAAQCDLLRSFWPEVPL